MKRMIKATAAFSLLHLAALTVSFITAVASSMDRFDTEMPEGILERTAGAVAEVLMAPGRYLWTEWAGRNLPDFVEWSLLILNSLLWGYVLAIAYTRAFKLKNK